MGAGSTISTRFLFIVVKKSGMVADTLNVLFRAFAWSLNEMHIGEFPRRNRFGKALGVQDKAGEDLADGFRGVLCQVRGDWQFYCEVMYFPQWNSAERMCWFRQASSTDRERLWSDFNLNAAWRDTLWTHETYLDFLRASELAIPILSALVIGFRLENIMIDVLHTIDQGVSSHVIGNVLWITAVIKKAFGGTTQAENLQNLQKDMKQWYEKHKFQGSQLQKQIMPDNVRTKAGWPKLNAKAAMTRHLATYALDLVQRFVSSSIEYMLALIVVQNLGRFYEILNYESMCVSGAIKAVLPNPSKRFSCAYGQLAALALKKGYRLWKATPKFHLFCHLLETQAVLQGIPRFFWIHADEDLVRGNVSNRRDVSPPDHGDRFFIKVVVLAF